MKVLEKGTPPAEQWSIEKRHTCKSLLRIDFTDLYLVSIEHGGNPHDFYRTNEPAFTCIECGKETVLGRDVVPSHVIARLPTRRQWMQNKPAEHWTDEERTRAFYSR